MDIWQKAGSGITFRHVAAVACRCGKAQGIADIQFVLPFPPTRVLPSEVLLKQTPCWNSSTCCSFLSSDRGPYATNFRWIKHSGRNTQLGHWILFPLRVVLAESQKTPA